MNAEFISRVFKMQKTAIKKQTEHTVQKAIDGEGYDTWYHQTGEANCIKLYRQWRKFLLECNSKHLNEALALK